MSWPGCSRGLSKERGAGNRESPKISSLSRPKARGESLPMSTAVKPRQLNLDELRRLKWLLGGAMALVSLWTVFFLDVEALSLVGVAGAAMLAALIWPQLP